MSSEYCHHLFSWTFLWLGFACSLLDCMLLVLFCFFRLGENSLEELSGFQAWVYHLLLSSKEYFDSHRPLFFQLLNSSCSFSCVYCRMADLNLLILFFFLIGTKDQENGLLLLKQSCAPQYSFPDPVVWFIVAKVNYLDVVERICHVYMLCLICSPPCGYASYEVRGLLSIGSNLKKEIGQTS